jgi:spore coat protein U-like protein
MLRRVLLPLSLLGALTLSLIANVHPVRASGQTAVQAIGVSVVGTCVITASDAMNFGNYDPVNANATTDLLGSATFSIDCSPGHNFSLLIGAGQNPGAYAGATRAMSNGTQLLAYDLYTSNAYSTVWDSANTVAVTGTGTTISQTVYGKIPHGQDAKIGTYSDTVTITATY